MYLKHLGCILFITIISCNSKSKIFKLNPVTDQTYNYTITKASSQEWTYQNLAHKVFDTVGLDIGLQMLKNINDTIIYKLIFNHLKIIPHPLKVTIIKSAKPQRKPFNYIDGLDLICNSLQGLSVQVNMSEDGIVSNVYGIDDLVTNISKRSNIEANTVSRMLLDYVSTNAVKDLLNRMLSIPRNKEVRVLDSWIGNITFITKAPVKVSNMYTVKNITGDSVNIDIRSIASTATTSKGDNVYLNGKQNGAALLSYVTGMPYRYHTNLETVTTTTSYNVVYKENFTVNRK